MPRTDAQMAADAREHIARARQEIADDPRNGRAWAQGYLEGALDCIAAELEQRAEHQKAQASGQPQEWPRRDGEEMQRAEEQPYLIGDAP